jgi:hypothetical protein
MQDSDWIPVLKTKEFVDYFAINDLIKLSLVCRKFRNSLVSELFKSFDLVNFAKVKNYSSCIILSGNEEYLFGYRNNVTYFRNPYKPLNSKLTESKEQFRKDINLLPSKPKKLIVESLKDIYYLPIHIIYAFPKLTTMNISNSQFQIQVFKLILGNLKFLNSLEVSSNIIYQYSKYFNNSTQFPIYWPDSLRELRISNNHFIFLENRDTPITMESGLLQGVSTECLQLTPRHIPKLVLFECEILIRRFKCSYLLEFLKLNPQIQELKFNGLGFDIVLLKNLNYINSLTSLSLNFRSYKIRKFDLGDIPTSVTITHLTIVLYHNSHINEQLLFKFQNLTKLSIEMHGEDFNKLFSLIMNFPRIKTINLKIYFERLFTRELIFPKIDNLKCLEFNLYNSSYFKQVKWNAESCKNLKLIEMKNGSYQGLADRPKLSLGMIGRWRTVYFPNRVSFYRND